LRSILFKVVAFAGNAAVWLTVLIGCLVISDALAQLYMLNSGSRPGEPISPDDLAPRPLVALMWVGYGACLVVVPFLLRSGIRRWWQSRAS
jgi:hypothetical protein